MEIAAATDERLTREKVIWLATVRPDGRPHLVPLWFVRHNGQIYLCVSGSSVKARNLRSNPAVALALEDGMQPVILEGRATVQEQPWPPAVVAGFQQKYDWAITTDGQYDMLLAIELQRLIPMPTAV